MADFLLVHGAWHGAWCWRAVTPALVRAGHRVHAVTLTGLGERSHLLHAGIDLKETPDGEWCCFEVNPCPGFIFFERHTGQPISLALAEFLHAGGRPPVPRDEPTPPTEWRGLAVSATA